MKTNLRMLVLIIFLTLWGCATTPAGPSKPGMPWISKVQCPSAVTVGETARVFFQYQGDELPAYAEVSIFKISSTETYSGGMASVNYRFENQYEVLIKLSNNPATWGLTFYLVDRKGRFSNELSCQVTVR